MKKRDLPVPDKPSIFDFQGQLWVIGKKIIGLGELIKFQQDDSHEDAHFALGEILEELGAEILEIKDSLEGTSDRSSR